MTDGGRTRGTLRERTRRAAADARPVAADMARRAWRYAWPSAGGQSNREYLRDRLVALPLLALITFGCFGWAYADVRGDSAYIKDRLTPALEELALARASVQIAQGEARSTLSLGSAALLSGPSPRYESRLSRATRQLNQVPQHDVLDASEHQELNVVIGLLDDYGAEVNRAQDDAGDPALSGAELSYAQAMLCSPGKDMAVGGSGSAGPSQCRNPGATGAQATSIVDRISALERELDGHLADRAAYGGRVLAAGTLSGITFVLLAAGTGGTMYFLNRRFRILVSLPLLAMAAPLLVLPVMAVDAVLAHGTQHQALGVARDLRLRTSPAIETDTERPFHTADPMAVATLTADADRALSTHRLVFRDGMASFAVVVGLAGAAVAGRALHDYGREYRLVATVRSVS